MTIKICNRSKAFTLVELLVVIAIIGALVGLLLPAVQAAREAARKSTCSNNLKQMGLALLNYHDVHGAFPLGVYGSEESQYSDDGFGWAVGLLPHLEEQALYDLIDPDGRPGVFIEAFRAGGEVIPGGDQVVDVFRCPTSELPSHYGFPLGVSKGYATSDYKACNGTGDSGLFFKIRDGLSANRSDGSEVQYTRVRVQDVTDGLSNTIAFGESSYYGEFIDWPIWLGAPRTDEAVLFKTQEPSIINCGIIPKTVENFRTLARDDDCAFSWHSGGAQFGFADGSVRFIGEDINMATYSDLGTKNDGHVIGDY